MCTSSIALITTLVRQFRTQQGGLRNAPLILVYAVVMGIITQIQTLGMGRTSSNSLMRALDECASIYKLAAEARARLLASLSESTWSSATQPDSDTLPASSNARSSLPQPLNMPDSNTDIEYPERMDNPSNQSFAATNFEMEGGLDVEHILESNMAFDQQFEFPELSDMNGDLHGWFSIGQMG